MSDIMFDKCMRCDAVMVSSAEAVTTEITRLRNELHIAQEWSARVIAGQEQDMNEITALRAEVEKLKASRDLVLEEAARCAEGPVYRTSGTGEIAIRGTDKGNWSVPMPESGYKGSDYGTGRYDAAAAIRALKGGTGDTP